MYCKITSLALKGIEAGIVSAEVDVGNGLPGINMVGFLSAEVREARERVRVALRNSGYPLPAKKITVNLSPADMRKEGTAFDLAIAMGILCGLGIIPEELLRDCCFIGELVHICRKGSRIETDFRAGGQCAGIRDGGRH